jgi:hypothetical protein
VDVKAGIIHILLKKKTPFLYKAEIFAERKIRQRIINEQKTEKGNRHPEQHLEKYFRRSLKCKHP